MSEANVNPAAALQTREIRVTGMTCDHCSRRVEKALRSQPGVTEVRVDRQTERATVTFDPGKSTFQALHEAVARSGYKTVPAA